MAYILKDSGAKAFVAHERFAEVAMAAADEAGIAADGRLAVGDVAGFASYAAVRDAQPTTLPEDRTIGDVMNYTSGTTGNPKGIYRKLLGVTPEQAALGLSGLLFLFNIQPQDDNVHIIGSPLYHTAVLRFGERVAAPRAHPGAHGQVAARRHVASHRRAAGHDVAHGAHPVPPSVGPARGRPGQDTTCPPFAT